MNFKCPKCGSSEHLARMYAAFYVPVDPDGEDKADNFDDHQSNTEMTDEFSCGGCGHEWIDEQ